MKRFFMGRVPGRVPEKGTKKYRERRAQNNIAVKKCRENQRRQIKNTSKLCDALRVENEILKKKIELLEMIIDGKASAAALDDFLKTIV